MSSGKTSKKQRQNVQSAKSDTNPVMRVTSAVETWMGPLPPPNMVKDYETIIPNAGDRMLKIVEQEQAQRHEIESGYLRIAQKEMLFRRVMDVVGYGVALFVFLACFGAGIWILKTGRSENIAMIVMGPPIIIAAASFVNRARTDKENKSNVKKIFGALKNGNKE